MARYIDAEVMREDWLENGENEYVYDTNAVLESIDNQPTADVVEVVHGEWELAGEQLHIEKVYLCTACRNYEAWGETEKTPYCPNCGAKMDGKKME